VRFSNLYHASDAIRKQPIVCLNHLAIFTSLRDTSEGEVVILDLGKE
jgi:hypothetical protein